MPLFCMFQSLIRWAIAYIGQIVILAAIMGEKRGKSYA